ncbi:MAG: hypothetical protein K8S18_03615 [Desulfobacula sp.]|nr:hypothetical protein [Desulfobacula sp.]
MKIEDALTILIEQAKPDKENCFTIEGKGEMVKDRGSLLPVIRLNALHNSCNGYGLP